MSYSDAGRVALYALPRVVQLVLASSAATSGPILMNYPVNRTVFRVVRGTRNDIEFFVLDIDRKPVDLTGGALTANIVDTKADRLLLSRALTVVDPARALYRLTILPGDMIDWPSHPLRWSVVATRPDGDEAMLYTDRDYTPYSHLEVLEGPRPAPAAPVVLDPSTFTVTDTVARSSAVPGSAALGYPDGLHTVEALLDGFSGSLTLEATIADQPVEDDWFEAARQDYEGVTGAVAFSAEGNFAKVRIALRTTEGQVSRIFVKA